MDLRGNLLAVMDAVTDALLDSSIVRLVGPVDAVKVAMCASCFLSGGQRLHGDILRGGLPAARLRPSVQPHGWGHGFCARMGGRVSWPETNSGVRPTTWPEITAEAISGRRAGGQMETWVRVHTSM